MDYSITRIGVSLSSMNCLKTKRSSGFIILWFITKEKNESIGGSRSFLRFVIKF